MKKIFAIALTFIMVFSFVACDKANSQNDANTKPKDEETMTGAWEKAPKMEITEAMEELLEKATKDISDEIYTPVAYLEYQVVAGTNHKILCIVTPADDKEIPKYAIAIVYEDLDGKVELKGTLRSDAYADVVTAYDSTDVVGYWNMPDTPDITEEADEAFSKATKDSKDGYKPMALLATQVVAGTNYSILAGTDKTDSGITYRILHVHADLEGNAEVTDTYDFE